MVRGKTDAEWWHTASLLWMTAEINRDRNHRSYPFDPSEFHPLHRGQPLQAKPGDNWSVEEILSVFQGT